VNNKLLFRLSNYEIHTITSVIKKFLKSLQDNLIPGSLWNVFVDAATNPDPTLAVSDIYQVKISMKSFKIVWFWFFLLCL